MKPEIDNLYSRENVRSLLDEIQTADFIPPSSKDILADIFTKVLHGMMCKERSFHLDSNSLDKANGFYNRSLDTSFGKLSLDIPRSRNGDFRPASIPKPYQRHDQSFEDLLHSLIITGDSKSLIINKLNNLGLNFSPSAMDELFDSIRERLADFKCSVLSDNYLFLIIDAYKVKAKDSQDNKIKNCTIYTVLAIDMDAHKQILGFYPFFGNENTDVWYQVFQNLISRGLKRVLGFICDDFSGISQVIHSLFPGADIQKCFVHLMRNVRRNTSAQDAQSIISILREIKLYDNYDKGVLAFQSRICEPFRSQYPTFISHIESRINEYVTFLQYPQTARKHLYTTNPIESVNSLFEKNRQKKSGFFQSLDCLEISFFLTTENMNQFWAKKPIPTLVSSLYELIQLFNLKYFHPQTQDS